jgi:hypothetical protein
MTEWKRKMRPSNLGHGERPTIGCRCSRGKKIFLSGAYGYLNRAIKRYGFEKRISGELTDYGVNRSGGEKL